MRIRHIKLLCTVPFATVASNFQLFKIQFYKQSAFTELSLSVTGTFAHPLSENPPRSFLP